MTHERHPIPDGHTCSIATMRSILDAIDAHLAAERAVYVHCLGGIGRTGMSIGCRLVRHGALPESARARVAAGFDSMPKRARMRSWTSPETPAQMQVVRDWLPNT